MPRPPSRYPHPLSLSQIAGGLQHAKVTLKMVQDCKPCYKREWVRTLFSTPIPFSHIPSHHRGLWRLIPDSDRLWLMNALSFMTPFSYHLARIDDSLSELSDSPPYRTLHQSFSRTLTSAKPHLRTMNLYYLLHQEPTLLDPYTLPPKSDEFMEAESLLSNSLKDIFRRIVKTANPLANNPLVSPSPILDRLLDTLSNPSYFQAPYQMVSDRSSSLDHLRPIHHHLTLPLP